MTRDGPYLLRYLFLLLLCCTPAPLIAAEAHQGTLTLLYSSNLDGELEPCGCSKLGDLGGLKRRGHLIDTEREIDPELILISGGGLLSHSVVAEPTKADFIFRGFSLLNYDAIGLRVEDRLYGDELPLTHPLPWLVSQIGLADSDYSKTIKRSGIGLTIFSWAPKSQEMGNGVDAALSVEPELLNALQRSKQRGELTILMTPLSQQQAVSQLPIHLIDIMMVAANFERYSEPEIVGNTLILRPGSRGMFLGRLKVSVGSGKVTDHQHQILSMPRGMDEPVRMQQWYSAYNAAVKADYQQRVRQRLAREQGVGG